jgi:glycosyltransferase involved in cell wall biosynthesis
MRILLITGSHPPIRCGVGDYSAELAKELSRRSEVVVGVVTDVEAKESQEPDQKVHLFPIVSRWDLRALRAIRRHAAAWRPDIVHMQFGSARYRRRLVPWLTPSTLALSGFTVVQTWHEWPEDPIRILRNLPNSLTPGGLIVVKPEISNAIGPWRRLLSRQKYFKFIPNASAIPRADITDAEKKELRARIAGDAKRIVCFFGFAHAKKGVEALFDVVDPKTSALVLISELDPSDSYHEGLLNRMKSPPWRGRAFATGFLPPKEAACVLAAADVVALPFLDGGGVWSTSTHAAVAQGTFVLVTSQTRAGYDAEANIYYARPLDFESMREAIRVYGGKRIIPRTIASEEWGKIADAHLDLYRDLLSSVRPESEIARVRRERPKATADQ